MISKFELALTQPQWALGYTWDIVLGRGSGATPMEDA
jgi:protocatechuate 3,4-dioxygenase beta subunit